MHDSVMCSTVGCCGPAATTGRGPLVSAKGPPRPRPEHRAHSPACGLQGRRAHHPSPSTGAVRLHCGHGAGQAQAQRRRLGVTPPALSLRAGPAGRRRCAQSSERDAGDVEADAAPIPDLDSGGAQAQLGGTSGGCVPVGHAPVGRLRITHPWASPSDARRRSDGQVTGCGLAWAGHTSAPAKFPARHRPCLEI